MKALKPKSERFIILLCFVLAVVVPTLTYFYLSATPVKTQRRMVSKKNSPDNHEASLAVNNAPLPQVKTEPIIISGACIFKPVKSLTPAERQFVLDSARKKLISVLKNKDSSFNPWMTLYTKPMTTTELEVLGDYILKQKAANRGGFVPVLKIQVYWNREVAEVCMDAGVNYESLFYNSSWDVGDRGGRGVENPKSLDDRGLYDYIVKHEFYALHAKPLKYDTINQVLYLELTSRCMIELIFNTFQALGGSLRRNCLFDGLPNLQQVTIIYKDSEDNEMGYGNYDFEYWQTLIQRDTRLSEMMNDLWDKLDRLEYKYKSKLISKHEYQMQTKHLREAYNERRTAFYHEEWLKLFPLITNKDFQLNKRLPLTHKDFRF